MTTIVDWHSVDGRHVSQDLRATQAKLTGDEGEVLLDFSGVIRLDPHGIFAVEDFAKAAEEKAVKVSLRGVNVDVYKVLKLARLTTRFSFVN